MGTGMKLYYVVVLETSAQHEEQHARMSNALAREIHLHHGESEVHQLNAGIGKEAILHSERQVVYDKDLK